MATLQQSIELYGYGTSEGAVKSWEVRGRKQEEILQHAVATYAHAARYSSQAEQLVHRIYERAKDGKVFAGHLWKLARTIHNQVQPEAELGDATAKSLLEHLSKLKDAMSEARS